MADRFVGEVRPYSGPHVGRSFVGFVYGRAARRADTGEMAHDFAFADMTEARRTRALAERDLAARLTELNGAQ